MCSFDSLADSVAGLVDITGTGLCSTHRYLLVANTVRGYVIF